MRLQRSGNQLDDLVVVDARIDGGPMFKRYQPRARGMAYEIKKRMSHIKVSLDTVAVASSDGSQTSGETATEE